MLWYCEKPLSPDVCEIVVASEVEEPYVKPIFELKYPEPQFRFTFCA